jgi:transcriptional regulator of arginine metabolism
MRYSRQNKILDLIGACEIDTQEKLAAMLKKSGFKATQATISRDIKELQLVKIMTPSGRYKYAAGAGAAQPVTERFVKIFRETIQTVSSSGNLIVIKTLSGCANAAAEAIDSLDFPNILGSIAGDNTIMLVVNDPLNVPALVTRFNEMIRQEPR